MLVHGLARSTSSRSAPWWTTRTTASSTDPSPTSRCNPFPCGASSLAEEYLPRREGWRRAWRTSSPVVPDQFLPAWEHLVDCLEPPPRPIRRPSVTAMSAVAHFAERYDSGAPSEDAAAWALLLDRLQANPIHARTGIGPRHGLRPHHVPLPPPPDRSRRRCAAWPTARRRHWCALPGHRGQVPLRDAVGAHRARHLPARAPAVAMSTEPFGTKVLFANFYRASSSSSAYREADKILTPVCGYNAGWEAGARGRALTASASSTTASTQPASTSGLRPTAPRLPVGLHRAHRSVEGRPDAHPGLRPGARRSLVYARLRLWGPATSTELPDAV